LLGKWKLHIIENKDSLGVWQQANWMKNGMGTLHYYNNDTVAVHFAPENYGDDGAAKPYWYIATYIYNADSNYVEHTRVKQSDESEIGKTVRRKINIKKDTLIMNADEFGFRLKWIKQDE